MLMHCQTAAQITAAGFQDVGIRHGNCLIGGNVIIALAGLL